MSRTASKNILENTWLILVPLVLCFAAYSFMLSSSFKTLDDEYTIEKGELIKELANLPTVFRTSYFSGDAYYRPLIIFSYMIEYHFFGLDPFYYNLTNVLVHMLTAFLVFVLMRLLLPEKTIALIIAAFFAIHPVHWEAVGNIAGRSILLCGLFGVAALVLYVLFRQKGSVGYLALSLGCFILALLSKESGGIFPLLVAGYEWFLAPGGRKDLKRTIMHIVPFAAVAAVYILWRHHLGITKLFYWRNIPENILGFLTFLRSVITDIRILVWPTDLRFDRMAKLIPSFSDPQAVATYLFFAVSGAALIRSYKNIPAAIQFFLFWSLIELLPVSQILVSVGVQPGYISTAEHFLYVPSIGFGAALVLAVSALAQQYPHVLSRRLAGALSFVYFVFFFLVTVQQCVYASNEMTMLERSLKLQPDNSRIRNSVALAYAKEKDFRSAEYHFQRAIASDPYSTRGRIGLGRSLYDQGRYFEALQELEKVDYPEGYEELLQKNLTQVYTKLIAAYHAKLMKESDNGRLYYSLGIILMKARDFSGALEAYQAAVRLEPDFKESRMNLATAYAIVGDPGQAIEAYTQLLQLPGPKNAIDHFAALNLADLYRRTGQEEKAQYYSKLAEELIK